MKNKGKIALSSLTLVAALVGLWPSDDDANDATPKSKEPAASWLNSLTSASPTHQDKTEANSEKSSPPTQPFKKAIADGDCLGEMFYQKALKPSNTPYENFSNLLWATESYRQLTREATIENAANGLGVSKAELIKSLKTAATSVFKDTPTSNLKSSLDWVNYWNHQVIAYEYAGLTDTGNPNESYSRAAVSYDIPTLIKNRDQYIKGAAIEILPKLTQHLQKIYTRYEGLRNNGKTFGFSLEQSLEDLSPSEKIDLIDKIDLLFHAERALKIDITGPDGEIRMDSKLYDFAKSISNTGILGTLITKDSQQECTALFNPTPK